ncbi:MAG: hypothetical protein KJ970_03615 [Candidatus Eisenbacteria bacterium]|uniref:Uncharacterized protein n=1 Tax=Eiseniibacteriota bacterium TaxID=2212470 RepID=A0A948RXD8_UNCEI|nr:hypothetical protein [Candidatus Eisenbacteria bacterium]MBU1948818.1 hypothetical protein [Candidatus Eisenbacteria bacterium]MBU2689989.1 hypothetical protein [Candidatus Eisenbacteria bacterium]
MAILHQIWFLLVSAWILGGTGWLTLALLGSTLPFDRRERIAAGVLVSAAWVALLHLLVLATTGRLHTILYGLLFLTLGQMLLLAVRRLDIRRKTNPAPAREEADRPGGGGKEDPADRLESEIPKPKRYAGIEPLWILLILAAILMIVGGGSLGTIHDSLDTVAYVRGLVETDSIQLVSPIYSPDPLPAPDPRRGTFHTELALISLASGIDPADLWRELPILLFPFALLVLFLLAREILASPSWALAATGIFGLTAYLTPDHFMQNIAYASRIGWVMGWVGWMAAYRFLREGGRRLGIFVVLTAPMLMGIHILSSAQFLMILGCLIPALLWSRSWRSLEWRRALLLTAGAVAAALPFLIIRLMASYEVINPMFNRLQGVLFLRDGWISLHPRVAWSILGWPGLMALALSPLLFRRARTSMGIAVLLTTAWIPFIFVFFPPTLMLMEHFQAHSLIFRLLLLIPTPLILTVLIRDGAASWKNPGRRWVRMIPAGLILLALILHVGQVIGFLQVPSQRRLAWEEQPALVEAMEWIQSELVEPRVILTDPLTGYAMPAYTRHTSGTPLNQHSSPTDAWAFQRMVDAQAVLNGFVGILETCTILDKGRADYVLLNQAYPRYQEQYGLFLSPLTYELSRLKFDSQPALFTNIYDRHQIIIYRYNGVGRVKHFVQGLPHSLEGLMPDDAGFTPGSAAPPPAGTELGILAPLDPPLTATTPAETINVIVRDVPNPFLLTDAEDARFAAPLPPGLVKASHPGFQMDQPAIEYLGMDSVKTVHPGEALHLTLYWRRTKAPMPLPYQNILFIESDPPDGFFARLPLQPIGRYIWEWRTGELYRFGKGRLPLEHYYPPFLWQPGEVYRDTFDLWTPPQIRPGIYRVHLYIEEHLFNPNVRLSQLLSERASDLGAVVATVEILPGGAGYSP